MIFTVSNKKINYLYNASGVKVEKKVTNGTNIKTTQYLDGFQYVNGDLSFFPHAEGYVRINGNPTKTKYWYDYVYNYTDHLEGGALKKIPVEIFSERASLSRWVYLSYTKDRLTGGLKILQEHHYYPFGLEHHNYNQAKYDISLVIDIDDTFVIARNAVDYKYKYQGQEWQDDLNLGVYQWRYRVSDPAIGRFWQLDPLAEKYHHWAPYVFSGNRVMDGIELEGAEFVLRKHFMNGDEHIRTEDVNYYQKSQSEVEAEGGKYMNDYRAASHGPEGEGVKHVYINSGVPSNEMYTDGNERWDFHGGVDRHGLYSGSGAITDWRGGENYDWNFQPIDIADAIAKVHDIDYAREAGYKYKGYAEDTRTLGADRKMIFRVMVAMASGGQAAPGIGDYFRQDMSGETAAALGGQLSIISSLADYKTWKVNRMQSIGLSPDKPQDILKVQIRNIGDFLRYSGNSGLAAATLIRNIAPKPDED